MATLDPLPEPETEEEAAQCAVRLILKAANYLATAANLAPEAAPIGQYVNASIRLRDLVHSLSPEKPSWSSEGAAIFDLKTRKRVN